MSKTKLKVSVMNSDIVELAFWEGNNVDVLPTELLEHPDVYNAAVQSVQDAGGALNISGWYPANIKLIVAVLKRLLDRQSRFD